MRKILLIEDDTDLFALLKYNLEKEGFMLTGSQTGKGALDRKSTRLNSIHLVISYAVFCLKKKRWILYFLRSEEGRRQVEERATANQRSVSNISQSTLRAIRFSLLFFFNDTATTEIYTLSLHDALPI